MDLKGFFVSSREAEAPHLPYPDLPLPVRRIVLQAVRHAWLLLRTKVGPDLVRWDEDSITTALEELLNSMLDAVVPGVDGFSTTMFQHLSRDGKVSTYDGSYADKMPDLTFRLHGPLFKAKQALWCEAKVVSLSSESLWRYCENGVLRFVDGRYAWTMPSALMVGYARDQVCVDANLAPVLERGRRRAIDTWGTGTLPQIDALLGVPTSNLKFFPAPPTITPSSTMS